RVKEPRRKTANKDLEADIAAPRTIKPRKLSFKEEKELAAIPARIERLEAEQDKLYTLMAQPEFFKKPSAEIALAKNELEKIEDELLETFERWEFLESVRQQKPIE
ncbi:MAG: ABC transporter ATP-binding protein, partial [Candidatus Omnitrophota bacterium]